MGTLLSPPLVSRAMTQILQAIATVGKRVMCRGAWRGGRRRNAVLGERVVAEEVRRKDGQQGLGELCAQTVVNVGKDPRDGCQEPAITDFC